MKKISYRVNLALCNARKEEAKRKMFKHKNKLENAEKEFEEACRDRLKFKKKIRSLGFTQSGSNI